MQNKKPRYLWGFVVYRETPARVITGVEISLLFFLVAFGGRLFSGRFLGGFFLLGFLSRSGFGFWLLSFRLFCGSCLCFRLRSFGRLFDPLFFYRSCFNSFFSGLSFGCSTCSVAAGAAFFLEVVLRFFGFLATSSPTSSMIAISALSPRR